jgi:hypothetical protein
LPVLILGLVLFVLGSWVANHNGAVGVICSVNPGAQGCSRIRFEQGAGAVAMIAGFSLALVGACLGLLRATASTTHLVVIG